MTQQHTDASPNNESDCVLIGVDRHGSWVVRTLSGDRGGLFVSRVAALRYAQLEFARSRSRIVMMPGHLELDLAPRGAAVPIGFYDPR